HGRFLRLLNPHNLRYPVHLPIKHTQNAQNGTTTRELAAYDTPAHRLSRELIRHAAHLSRTNVKQRQGGLALAVFEHFPLFVGTLWGRTMEKNRQIAAALCKFAKLHKITKPA
ncbi:MAG TPA: hypothetical protein VFM21_03990, partial [Terriglobia bacterium]|nr:hypothetical protein [Terriglobia bacterium]